MGGWTVAGGRWTVRGGLCGVRRAGFGLVGLALVGCAEGDGPLAVGGSSESTTGTGASAPDGLGAILDAWEADPAITVVGLDSHPTGELSVELRVRQPVDHADPDGAAFDQRVVVDLVDPEAPTVLFTSGYHLVRWT